MPIRTPPILYIYIPKVIGKSRQYGVYMRASRQLTYLAKMNTIERLSGYDIQEKDTASFIGTSYINIYIPMPT